MDINDILELTRAGFTKEDIMAIASAQKQPEQPGADTTTKQPAEPVAKTPEAQPENDTSKGKEPEQSQSVTMSNEQFTQLLQKLNLQGASIDVPEKKSPESILGDHFRGLFGSDSNKKGDA